MGSGTIALFAAIVGVAGTLFAPVLSQRLVARVQREQFERQQQMTHGQWLREQGQSELAQKRACYVTTNAAFRRYRIELMNYLWHVHRGDVTARAQEALEAARHGHGAAFAEAQMIASAAVLRELDVNAKALSSAYGKIKYLEEGNPEPAGSFEEIGVDLAWLWDRWKVMRGVMRQDLGINDAPTRPPD
ncbi:hypothetical protein ABT010_17920 [Streptomyces sp. NPDC002668]|uniref:hypothetical protein n=1 Tax=Streptomyces sp. NPDC002668 TaxID=3154422 RepID=UPI00331C6EEA